jgi:outer membrane receptor protein involved in Fe transport
VLNVPLIPEQLALRAAVFRQERDGYVRNIAGDDQAMQAAAALYGASGLALNKDHVGSSESVGGRISALWQPVDELKLTLTYFTQKDAQADRLFELQSAGPYRRADYQFGDTVGGNEDALRLDVDILNLVVEYDLGWGSLYSSTASLEQRFIRKWDIGPLFGEPVMPAPQINVTDAKVFTQEVRFASSFDGPFGLIAGAYYEDSETPSRQQTFFGGDASRNPFASVLLWQTALDRQVEQIALFGELSYDVTDRIELTVGGRAFEYDARYWTTFYDSVVIPNSSTDESTSESGRTAKAGIEFKPSDDTLIYASWSQGFRLGQPLATELLRSLCDQNGDGLLDGSNISSTLDRIDSDRLDSYELGAKLSVLGGRGMLSTALYHNDWTDVPVLFTAPGCLQSTTINGGRARARGIEAEGSFRLPSGWQLSFGVGYVESELTATTSLGARGDRMNFTPEINGSLGIEYGFSLFGRTAFVRGDYTYFGSYFTETGERGEHADAYSLINLRAGVNVFEQAELRLRVDNLADSDAFTAVVGPGGFPPGYGVRLMPRTIGLGISYSF